MKIRMPLILLIALAAAFCVSTSGCGYWTQYSNVENTKKMRIGMTKQEVLDVMGKPLEEDFCSPNVWYYYTQTKWHDGFYTRDECMPVMFKDGKLLGWGNDYFNKMYFSNQHIK